MEARSWLATGHARSANARYRTRDAWIEVTSVLNSDGSGCVKTWQQWCKYWKDKKGNIKRKVSARNIARQRTGGGVEEIPELNAIEERILSLIGGESFAVGDRHLEINPFLEPELPAPSTSGGQSDSILQNYTENDPNSEQVEIQVATLPLQLDESAFQASEPLEGLNIILPPSVEEMNISRNGEERTPVLSTLSRRAQRRQLSPVVQPTRAVRRRILQQSPVGSARRRRTMQSSPGTSAPISSSTAAHRDDKPDRAIHCD